MKNTRRGDRVICSNDVHSRRGRCAIALVPLLAVLGILGLLACLMLPSAPRAREPARRSLCKNNLKQIALALYNYHDDYGSFPPVYTVDADGRPLHSWRTLILPYMDQKPMYDRIDLSKPWNDPANAEAFKARVPAYRCPSMNLPEGQTTYLGVAAPGGVFGSLDPTKVLDIKDGPSSTLLVIEGPSDQSVHWMSPEDADESFIMRFGDKTKFPHAGGTHGLLADGAVRFLRVNLAPAVRRALISINAGDTVGDF